jgi:hypothetical protein
MFIFNLFKKKNNIKNAAILIIEEACKVNNPKQEPYINYVISFIV